MKPVMAAAAASTEAREEELVASAQDGNAEAFEALFRRYRDRIGNFVLIVHPNTYTPIAGYHVLGDPVIVTGDGYEPLLGTERALAEVPA